MVNLALPIPAVKLPHLTDDVAGGPLYPRSGVDRSAACRQLAKRRNSIRIDGRILSTDLMDNGQFILPEGNVGLFSY